MKYLINSYDAQKDIATVTLTYKFKTVQQPPLVIRAHHVPIEEKLLMDSWARGAVAGKKQELRNAEAVKTVDPVIVTEQTVTDPVE